MIPIAPIHGRRTEAAPRTAAAMARIVPMPISSARLSFAPNSRIAKSFNQGGVASIATPPTAIIGEDAPPKSPAASCATPSATAPDRSPTSAPTPHRRGSVAGAIVGSMSASARVMRSPGRYATRAVPLRRGPP